MPFLARLLANRWTMAAGATAGMAGAYGGITTISVLISPFEQEFGWLRGDISIAYMLLTLGAAFGGLIAGRLADRLSAGAIALAGVVIMGLCLVLVAYQTSLLGIQLTYLTLGFFGFSCLYSPVLAAVAQRFDRDAGLAMGIVTAGGAMGQAIAPPLFQLLVDGHGWRMACVLFGIGFIAVMLPMVSLIGLRRAEVPQQHQAFAAPASWPVPPAISLTLLCAAALFCCTLMAVPTVHLIPYATGARFSPATAASIVTVLMLAGCAGRIATGWIIDRIGSLASYIAVSLLQTGTVYLFVQSESLWVLYAVAAAYGLGFGGVMTALVCAVRDAVPRRHVGAAMALVGLLAWLGMGAGGYQAGLCFDLSGGYELSFRTAFFAGLGNLGALVILALLLWWHKSGGFALGRWRQAMGAGATSAA